MRNIFVVIIMLLLLGCNTSSHAQQRSFYICVNGMDDYLKLLDHVSKFDGRYEMEMEPYYSAESLDSTSHYLQSPIPSFLVSVISNEGFGFTLSNHGLDNRQIGFFFFEGERQSIELNDLYSEVLYDVSKIASVNEINGREQLMPKIECT